MLGLGNSIYSSSTLEDTFGVLSNYSLSLDGAGDRATISSITLPISTNGANHSISFWAKRTDNSSIATVLGDDSVTATKRVAFDAQGDLLEIEGTHNGQTSSAAVTADTNWHYYVITWVGRSGGHNSGTIIYEDATAIETTVGGFGETHSSLFNFDTIGSAGDETAHTREFKGLLYQIAIWDTTLDQDAITALYNSGSPIPVELDSGNYDSSDQLLYLWKFNEGAGSTSAGAVGSRTATLLEGASFSSTTPS